MINNNGGNMGRIVATILATSAVMAAVLIAQPAHAQTASGCPHPNITLHADGNGVTKVGQTVVYRKRPTEGWHPVESKQWHKVPQRLHGVRVDLVNGTGTKRLRPRSMWNVGDTTCFIWPGSRAAGTS